MPALAWWIFAVLLGALGAPAAAAPANDASSGSGAEPEARPSVLLVTLDTTRADRVGAVRNGRPVTPTIDALAKHGVVFESALAPAPVTLPSHATILTGVYPSAHGVRDNGVFRLAPEAELVSEVLAREGWRTGAFVGSYVLDARFGLDQGFERYRGPGITGLGSVIYAERPAHQVVDDAIEWLGSLPAEAPFFAWVHLFDPHAPFDPPKEWRTRFEDAYDAEIAFADDQVGRLLRFLRRRDPGRALVVVVTADHGESLGAHGEESHSIFIYQETMRVPLVVSGPGVPSGVRIATPVSIAQIAPTLLDLAGPGRHSLPAVRVRPLLTPGVGVPPQDEPPAIVLESYSPYHSHRWHAYRGMVWGNHKLIRGRAVELYDLEADPGEAADLAGEDAERLARFERRFEALRAEHPPLHWSGGGALDAKGRALLQQLGYIEASTDGDPFAADLPDPRDRIGDLAVMGQAIDDLSRRQRLRQSPPASAWEADRERKAVLAALTADAEKLHAILAANPRDPTVAGLLGGVEAARGRHEVAIPLLEQTLAVLPGQTLHRVNLATAYYLTGRVDEAIREIERAIADDPDQARYYRWLATHYLETGEYQRASWWLRAMSEAPEPGSDDAREVARWIAIAHANMRRRGHEPADPATLPLEEPGRR